MLKSLGVVIIIVLLFVGWQTLFKSTRPADLQGYPFNPARPPKLQAWEKCKADILRAWAQLHSRQVDPLLYFTQDHFYSFGAESRPDKFDDHDSRGTARADAERFGVSERELSELDQRIRKECGAFPKS